MTPKGVLSAIGKALLYFFIYFGWQLITVNWFSIGASLYLWLAADHSAILGEAITPTEIEAYTKALTDAITQEVYDMIVKYTLHLTLISGIATFVTLFVIFKARGKKLFSEVSLTRLKPSQIITMFALGGALNTFVSLLLTLIPFPAEWIDSYANDSSLLIGGNPLLVFLVTVLAAPIVEEIVFRGLCYTRLKTGLPMLASMLICAWGFGLVHGTAIWFIYASLFGFVLCWIFEKYRSLTACVIMHLGFNLFGMISSGVTDLGDTAFWLLLISSAIASAALIIQILRTSPYRIELEMPKSEK